MSVEHIIRNVSLLRCALMSVGETIIIRRRRFLMYACGKRTNNIITFRCTRVVRNYKYIYMYIYVYVIFFS